ncbi:MAG: DUF262 domain-containing protein [Haliangiales bacterium]
MRELVQKVSAGEVRVPRFQRPLRWKRADVISLLDSVWRGYPIGSLLFWKRHADADTIVVGGAQLNAPKVTDAWWVVDGQQRTTALAATLLDLDHHRDLRWVARFDPDQMMFLSGSPTAERIGLDVPVSVLGDLRRLGRWIRDSALDEQVINLIEEVQQRLLDYTIPAYVIDTDDEQALRGVFARMNSSGARMRADEVFQALLGAPSRNGHASLDLNSLQQVCNRDDFGTPPRSEILKAVLAMSGINPTQRLDDLSDPDINKLVSPEDATEALVQTVEFLKEDCNIPHVSLIPYPVVFVILARWFHIYSSDAKETRSRLARWVWRGAATGIHQRAAVSGMREQVRMIDSDEEEEVSIDRLLGHVNSRPNSSWELRRFHLRNAQSRIETLALLDQRPSDRDGPISVAELVSGGRIAREVFRSEEWQDLNPQAHELARTVANRVLLGPRHTGLSAELRTWRKDHPALRSHMIDEKAFDYLVTNQIGAFLRHRAAKVRQQVEAFMSRKVAWDEPDLRPRDTYLEIVGP